MTLRQDPRGDPERSPGRQGGADQGAAEARRPRGRVRQGDLLGQHLLLKRHGGGRRHHRHQRSGARHRHCDLNLFIVYKISKFILSELKDAGMHSHEFSIEYNLLYLL